MPASWAFQLTDANGNALAELDTASGRTVAYKRNSYAEVNLTLSHEDDAAALLLNALANTGIPKLKGYRRGAYDSPGSAATLRFRGPLAAISEQSDENSILTATFRSPFSVLVGDGDKTGRFVQDVDGRYYSAIDAGAIAKDLIDAANTDSPTGLATDASLIVATKLRDRSYPAAQNIGSAVTDLTSVLDGFDFWETWVDGAGTTDAYFNVAQSLGSTVSTAKFEYGPGTLSNVASVARTTTPPTNCVFITGGNGLTSTYHDAASVAKYGCWWTHVDFSTIVDQSVLDDKARAFCRTTPIKTVTLTPELFLDNCPKPFDDWDLGDTVTFYAKRGAFTENTQLRVNGFSIPIDEDGYESLSVDDATDPASDAVLKASLIAEVLAE